MTMENKENPPEQVSAQVRDYSSSCVSITSELKTPNHVLWGRFTFMIILTFFAKIPCVKYFFGIAAKRTSSLAGIAVVGRGAPDIHYYV